MLRGARHFGGPPFCGEGMELMGVAEPRVAHVVRGRLLSEQCNQLVCLKVGAAGGGRAHRPGMVESPRPWEPRAWAALQQVPAGCGVC